MTKKCYICKKKFKTSLSHIKRGQGKYCNNKCKGIGISKENNYRWKGGRIYDDDGYVLIYNPDHPNAKRNKKYILEHRLIMEKYIRRYLNPKESVHHKNGKKDDNRIENLQLMTFEDHRSYHTKISKRDLLGRFKK